MTADWAEKPEAVPYSDLADPQSLNLYTYVRNNPVSRTDPGGHCLPDCTQQWIGAAKAVVNSFISGANLLGAAFSNGTTKVNEDGTTTSSSPQIPEIKASNTEQSEGMFGANLAIGAAAVAGVVDLFVAPDPIGTSTIGENSARGGASESRVLNDIGETKNTQTVSGSEGRSIPDFQNSHVIGEIKDVKTVSNTRQLRIQKDAAQKSGREHQLITGQKRT